MPTRDRRAFARQAIWYFLRQDYASKELIVLDDGDDAIADLTDGDERIRYVRLPARTTVGGKRNLGRELARGELVAHWDDDDWAGPRRLSTQVSELLRAGADVHACAEVLHYRVDAGDAWSMRARWPAAPDLPSGPLLYRRAIPGGPRFADANTGEQRPFLAAMAPERVHLSTDASWYLAVVHGSNTAGCSLDDGRWTSAPFGAVDRLLGADSAFYAALRNRDRAPTAVGAGVRGDSVTVVSHFRSWDGYGLMAEYLALGMARAGASVGVVPLTVDTESLGAELRSLLASSTPSRTAPALYYAPPPGASEACAGTTDLFVNTMWENDRLPRGWADALNVARAVIVPTRYVARVFRRSGVVAPLEVVPEGVDPQMYPYVERPEREGLTTLVVATFDGRKHVAEAVAAWQLAFADDPAARLVLKGKLDVPLEVADPRVEVVTGTERTRGIAHWYEQADVLLALGSEGFGLPLVEGMASGLPVVALSSEGQGDVCEDADGLVLDVPPARWERGDDTVFGPAGVRGVPDVDAVAARLRWVAGHRAEARELGREASAWAHRERDVWHKGEAVLEIMEQHLSRRRPLRRLRTVWPIDAVGLRPYVSALTAQMDRVRVVSDAPEVAGIRLLHVEHPGSLEERATLTARVVETALARVPVVVTAHAVVARTSAWERDATALVATTRADARALSLRWPGKRVEWIPYGCPPVQPPGTPSTARRGRRAPARCMAVVGACPEAERAARRAGWSVRPLTPGRRSQDDLAGLLSRDADLVVVADAARHRLELGAALASGVPVLALADPVLADLDGAVMQTDDMAVGAERALTDDEGRRDAAARARDYSHDHSWHRIAQRHLALWTELEAS